jgi:hypothetical protein
MFRRLLALTATVVAAGVVATGAAADSTFSDRLFYDSGPLGGFRDMAGFDVGWVTSYQRQSGDLQVNIAIRGADASTTYFVWFECGPTHATTWFGFFTGTSVTTGPTGRANVSFTITAAQLAQCGSGSFTGHLDLEGPATTLAATGIEYTNP